MFKLKSPLNLVPFPFKPNPNPTELYLPFRKTIFAFDKTLFFPIELCFF